MRALVAGATTVSGALTACVLATAAAISRPGGSIVATADAALRDRAQRSPCTWSATCWTWATRRRSRPPSPAAVTVARAAAPVAVAALTIACLALFTSLGSLLTAACLGASAISAARPG